MKKTISDIFETLADGVFLVSSDGEIKLWNRSMTRFTGMDPHEVIGRKVTDVVRVDPMALFLNQINHCLKGNSFTKHDPFVWIKTESLKTTFSFSPYTIDHQETGCLIICRQVFNKEKEQIFELVRTSPISSAIYASDGSAIYFNKAYADLWGLEFSATDGLDYNILKDEQLIRIGILPLLQKAFTGKTVELPALPYNPSATPELKNLNVDKTKYLKGYLFPLEDKEEPFKILMVVRDITEQRQAEEVLRINNRQFEILTNSIPGVLYEFHQFDDGTGIFDYISQGCMDMFGITVEEAYANPYFAKKLIHKEDLESFMSSLNMREANGSIWQWEGRIIVHDELKWISVRSRPSHLEDDITVRYGLIQDVTEKKNYEEQQLKAEEKLRIALEASNAGIWDWDVESNRRSFNNSWMKKCGYNILKEDELFQNWENFIHPADLPMVKKKLLHYLKQKVAMYEAEYRFKKANGEYIWVNERGSSTAANGEGRVLRATGTIIDIQQEKLSKDKIQRQEQLFTHLFRNAPLGIVFLDESFTVIQVNPGITQIFGYQEKDLIGTKLDDVLVPDELIEESAEINASTLKGDIRMLETHRNTKKGIPVPVIIYTVPVFFQDRTIGIYGIYVDITERKKVERELKVRNHELDNFVYKVSHDLRAPLTSIMGLSNLAQYEKETGDPFIYINMIDNRIRQLDNFIKDILSHSKNLKLDIVFTKIDFEKLIDECFENLNYLSQVGNIEKRINITGVDFFSDYWRISEVMRNLISNAIKYSQPRANSFIEIDIQLEATYASIYFADNGIGIDEVYLPKVFEMFYRATEAAEGSGIGLYIVKNAIERLGGVIRIRSEHNKGTSFEITLPNAAKQFHEANTVGNL